ncbi:MAG: hypothetical protein ACJ8ER_09725 [Allosphingosinicella sp.]
MANLSSHGAKAFNTGLAALAAVSAGFVAFAMPEPVLSGLVQATGLPHLLPAAQPPLGDTARLAVVGAALLFAFAGVWLLMSALDRLPARRATPQAEPEPEAPRVRRADAHPDAPARRPLLAARDLGEPLELEEAMEAPVVEAQVADEPVAETEHRPLPAFLVPQPAEAELEPEAEEVEPEPLPESESEPGPVPLAELADRLPEAEAEDDQPLTQLVSRIEFGLKSKRQALPAVELPTEEPAAEEERVGHRLRSAINDLQKIASTGN